MAVKIVEKTKPTTKAKKKAAEQNVQLIALMVDELASLKAKIDPLKPLVKKYEQFRDNLKKLIPAGAPADQSVTFHGTLHDAEFSPQAETRTITNVREVHKLLGDEVFYGIVKVNLGDLDTYLTAEELEGVIEKSRSGSRTCTIKMKEPSDG